MRKSFSHRLIRNETLMFHRLSGRWYFYTQMPLRIQPQEVKSMTMVKREPNSIWSRVRDDRDVDDLIFCEEFQSGREEYVTCSER